MRSWMERLGRGALVAGTAATLGFGAFVALAPVRGASAQGPPACNTQECRASCQATGARTGHCDDVGCVCIL